EQVDELIHRRDREVEMRRIRQIAGVEIDLRVVERRDQLELQRVDLDREVGGQRHVEPAGEQLADIAFREDRGDDGLDLLAQKRRKARLQAAVALQKRRQLFVELADAAAPLDDLPELPADEFALHLRQPLRQPGDERVGVRGKQGFEILEPADAADELSGKV